MKKIVDGIVKIEEIFCVALLVVMCVIIFAATVARFTQLFVIDWAEELARYCMIWAVFLGIGIAAARGQHFSVEALSLFCPRKVLNVIQIICAGIVVIFAGFCVVYGGEVLVWQMKAEQITASLHWPMWMMYLSIPVGMVLMAVCYCYRTYEIVTGKVEKSEEVEVE